MKNFALTALICVAATGLAQSAMAQNAVLADMYGRGVHAYYAGNLDEAYQYLTTAIENDIQDPRAYYFRGIVSQASGRPDQAESDWKEGAEMEAAGGTNPAIGRSLSRFQGSARLQLEQIRQQAKLEALAKARERSEQRYGELGVGSGRTPAPAPAATPPSPTPAPSASASQPAADSDAAPAEAAQPAEPAASDNPFADDLADGDPEVTADDALEGAMEDPFAGEEPAGEAAAPAANDNPFGAGNDAGNPFGGGDAGGDPFGGGGGNDPFGGGNDGGGAGGNDPFGGGEGASEPAEDPFGGDPFGG